MTWVSDSFCFFLQAEDGIRYADVTGVQTCALPIYLLRRHASRVRAAVLCGTRPQPDAEETRASRDELAALAMERGTEAVGERLLPRLVAAATPEDQPEVVRQYR